MSKHFWKTVLLITSCIWILAAIFSIYAASYGFLTFEWHRFFYGIVTFGIFTLIVITIAILSD